MSQLKGPVVVSLIILLSFLSGYKKNDLLRFWDDMFSEAPQEVESSKPAEATPPEAKPPSLPTIAVSDNPYKALMSGTRRAPNVANPPNVAPAPGRGPGGVSLGNSLNAMRPRQVTEERRRVRNAYFEKLSQQLKELQGEGPPPEKPTEASSSASSVTLQSPVAPKVASNKERESDAEAEDLLEEFVDDVEEEDLVPEELDAEIVAEEEALEEEFQEILAEEMLLE